MIYPSFPGDSRFYRRACRGATWRIATLALLAALPVAAQNTTSLVRAEVERLRQSVRARPVPDGSFPGLAAEIDRQLQVAADAVAAGRVYLSLSSLAEAEDLLQGGRELADRKAEIAAGGLTAFQAEWNKVNATLEQTGREANAVDWSHTPAAIRALAETARAKMQPLSDGARAFSTIIPPPDALFNLGEAQGQAEFARFCAGLRASRLVEAPRRSLLPELQALQAKVNAAFVPPRSIEQHTRFIQLNSALKLARDLDAARSYSGALHQYLVAVLQYALLDAPAPDAARQAALQASLAKFEKKLGKSSPDDSIGLLAVEFAAAQIAPSKGSPSADAWKSAAVIVDKVLPAYFAARKAAPASTSAPGKAVEITLVRWPYT